LSYRGTEEDVPILIYQRRGTNLIELEQDITGRKPLSRVLRHVGAILAHAGNYLQGDQTARR